MKRKHQSPEYMNDIPVKSKAINKIKKQEEEKITSKIAIVDKYCMMPIAYTDVNTSFNIGLFIILMADILELCKYQYLMRILMNFHELIYSIDTGQQQCHEFS